MAGPAALLLLSYSSPGPAVALVGVAVFWSVALRLRPVSILMTSMAGAALGTCMVASAGWYAGRAAVLFTLAAVTVAHLGVFGPQSPSASASRRGAGDVVPLISAMTFAAGMVFWRTENQVASTICLGVPSLIVLVGRSAGPTLRRLELAVDRVSLVVAHRVWVGIMAFVAIPTIYLPGAVLRTVDAVRGGDVGVETTWHRRDVTPIADLRESSRMFASTPPSQRRHRLVVLASVVVIGLVVALTVGEPRTPVVVARQGPTATSPSPASESESRREQSVPAPGTEISLYSARAAFAGVEFADTLAEEQSAFFQLHVPNALTQYEMPEFSGTLLNTSNGERRTYRPRECACPTFDVWLLGGSGAFGIGQRDHYTIASWIARLGESKGINLRVHNLAMYAWVLAQEVARVEQEIAATAESPDLVVFLDGFNDSFASVQLALSRGAIPDGPTAISGEEQQRFEDIVRQGDGALARAIDEFGGPRVLVNATVRRYRDYHDRIRSVLATRGIESAFFFQPDAFNSDLQSTDLTSVKPWLSPVDRQSFDRVLGGTAVELEKDGVVNLRGVAAEYRKPVFFDEVHMSEPGARLVAEAIFRHVEPSLVSAKQPSR